MAARGEVWRADFGPRRGSAPAYRRPGVVVSSDSLNESRVATVAMVPFTSNVRLARFPGNVLIERRTANLETDSVANVSQIATIDKQDLDRRLGALPPELMAQIDEGLRLALAL